MKRTRVFLVFILAVLGMSLSSCHDHDDPIPEVENRPTHTLLIYMMGDNSLTEYCGPNINLLKKGLLDAIDDINLVIYKDNRDSRDSKPTLFQLKRVTDNQTNVSKIDTVMIKQFDDNQLEDATNSCDPTILAEVVNTTFQLFDTEVKGLELWSHGMSWAPSPQTKSTRYIGQDNYDYMELWTLREALENCPHLDYISFDACFMGTAEVACELRGVTDYIYASINEIMGYGFPYSTMLPILASCKEKKDVKNTLMQCLDDFVSCGLFTRDGYTITLLETAKSEALANAVARLRNSVPDKLTMLRENAYSLESTFQHYGRSLVGTRYHFYEIQDYIDYLATDGSAEVNNIVNEIDRNNIVVKYAFSDVFLDELNLQGCKGLGVSVPEFFFIAGNEEHLTRVYGMTKWGKALGY